MNFTLHSARGGRGRQSQFGDRQSWTLESRLPHLFKEIDERIIELRAHDEARRIKAEQEAEAARIAAVERERQWHVLMRQARERLLEDHRAGHARREAEAWRTATALLDYCDAIESNYPSGTTSVEWVRWMRTHALKLDPLTREPTLPETPEETAENLQQYLPAGWSVEGPEQRPRPGRPTGW